MQPSILLLRPIAPTLAQVLDGPFHALARKYIIKHLPETLSLEATNDEAQLEELLTDPVGLQALKSMDNQFAAEIKSLGLNIPQLDSQPENKPTLSVKKLRTNPQFLLSLTFIAAYFCIVVVMFVVESADTINTQKSENSFMGELQILLGALTAGIGQILSYWFGRSGDKKATKSTDDPA